MKAFVLLHFLQTRIINNCNILKTSFYQMNKHVIERLVLALNRNLCLYTNMET